MNPQNLQAAASSIGTLAKVAVLGGLGVYGAANSIFNVEGGHRAIVFNRLGGIKDKVGPLRTGKLLWGSSGGDTRDRQPTSLPRPLPGTRCTPRART